MKHRLILSLCVALLATFGVSSAQADTDVSLNLYYTNPNDTSAGGTWNLVVKTDSEGVTGLSVNLDPNTFGTVGHQIGNEDPNLLPYPSSYSIPTVTGASIGHDLFSGTLGINAFTDRIELVFGQDPNGLGIVSGVGTGGPGTIASDVLGNSTWDGASVVASGVFGAVRPAFVSGNEGSGNELSAGGTVISECATGGCLTFTVRGDSVSPDNLAVGDVDRDRDVDGDDLNDLLVNFNQSGKVWDQGDVFNNDGLVNGDDLNNLLVNFNTTQTPPAIGVIPEPASLALFALASLGLAVRRRL